jgi:ABC-2 type transport system ATP-binding protein
MRKTTVGSPPHDEVVAVEKLSVSYGETVAVQDISLSIRRAEIFGILGPNGAGKTTTVECIGGLRRADRGRIRVLGLDPVADRRRIRELVGVQLQASELPDKLQVKEALELFAAFYPNPRDPAELMERLGLQSKTQARFSSLSGGQRQRLSIALALIGRPQLAILDELTTGLDPSARRETWELIENIRAEGVTVILVTHFMEEAQHLCDRVAVVQNGRVRALDTPAGLAAGVGQHLHFRPRGEIDPARLGALEGVSQVRVRNGRYDITGGGDLVAVVMEELLRAGVVPLETQLEPSSLDDAFVQMTTESDCESEVDAGSVQSETEEVAV